MPFFVPKISWGEPKAGGKAPLPAARPHPAQGLTLLELVVVVAILAVLALPAMLRFAGGGLFGGAPPAQAVAQRLTGELARMRDRALFGQQVIGLRPRADGWDWEGGGAIAGPKDPALALVWHVDGRPLPRQAEGAPPPVRLFPDGRGTPFELRVTPAGPVCRFDGWSEVACGER